MRDKKLLKEFQSNRLSLNNLHPNLHKSKLRIKELLLQELENSQLRKDQPHLKNPESTKVGTLQSSVLMTDSSPSITSFGEPQLQLRLFKSLL